MLATVLDMYGGYEAIGRFPLQPYRSKPHNMDTTEYAMFRYDTDEEENGLITDKK